MKILLALFLTLFLAVSCLLGYYFFETRQIPFDPVSWRQARSAGDPDTAFRMRDALVATLNEQAPDRAAILSMLGAPEAETKHSLHYYLGVYFGHYLFMDEPWTLSIHFEKHHFRAASIEHEQY